MCSGELRTDPSTAEYQVLDYLLTDDELVVMSEMKIITPYTAGMLARKTGFTKEKTRRILEEIADKAYFMDVKVPKTNAKVYMLVPFAPGLFEFQMVRPGFVEANPKIAELFARHAFESHDVAKDWPMGVGIMRVVPVESSLPAGTRKMTMERDLQGRSL